MFLKGISNGNVNSGAPGNADSNSDISPLSSAYSMPGAVLTASHVLIPHWPLKTTRRAQRGRITFLKSHSSGLKSPCYSPSRPTSLCKDRDFLGLAWSLPASHCFFCKMGHFPPGGCVTSKHLRDRMDSKSLFKNKRINKNKSMQIS